MNRITKLAALAMVCIASLASAENGVTDKEIVIGQFAVISGPAAQLGLRMQLGMQTYFKAINAQGGVNGRTIRLVTRDDGYEPEKAVAAVKALISRAIAALWLATLALCSYAQPAPMEGAWIARDFRFHTGEVLPELRLHYQTVGAPTGEPVLVLHGTTGSGAVTISYRLAGSCTLTSRKLAGRPSATSRSAKRTSCSESSDPSIGRRIFIRSSSVGAHAATSGRVL